MSSTPSRSPLLPPYAAPFADSSERERSASVSARTPYVPPTYAPRAAVSAPTSSDFSYDLASSDEVPVSEAVPGLPGEHFPPTAEADSSESLPWIEAFAEDEVDAGGEVLAGDEVVAGGEGMAGDEAVAGSTVEAEPELTTQTDTWAIDDATVSISHLAEDLTAASGITPPAPANEVHSPWKDDEAWMDIMPALPNSGSADPAMDTSWARAFAEPPAPMLPPPLPVGDAQAAAASLEAVARRLRSGELRVPGFHADAGDAAALAATLASLLGGHE